MPTLEERVAALEARSALSTAPTDTISPNYLTVTPDGAVSANFSGVIAAEGVTLPLGTSSLPPDTTHVQWKDASGNRVVVLEGYEYNGADITALNSVATAPETQAQVNLNATAEGAAQLLAQAAQSGAASTYVKANLDNDGVLLVDGTGASSFLRLLSNKKLRIAYGTALVTAAADTTIIIPHALGATPVGVFATPLGWAGYLYSEGPDATNIYLRAGTALNNNYLYWMALG